MATAGGARALGLNTGRFAAGCAFDAIVIDPPRAGAERQVAEICKARTPVVAYVSCNPVTFARDAAALDSAGFHLEQLRVVDQFRWSTHTELVASFRFKPS